MNDVKCIPIGNIKKLLDDLEIILNENSENSENDENNANNSYENNRNKAKEKLATFLAENELQHPRQIKSTKEDDYWEIARIAFYENKNQAFEFLMNEEIDSGLLQEDEMFSFAKELNDILENDENDAANQLLVETLLQEKLQAKKCNHIDELRTIGKKQSNEMYIRHLWTLSHVAADKHYVKLAKFLFLGVADSKESSGRANTQVSSHKYHTPLHIAADSNCVQIARVLKGRNADFNALATWLENRERTLTPLVFALLRWNLEMFQYLLENGADPEIGTKRAKGWEDGGIRDYKPVHLIIAWKGPKEDSWERNKDLTDAEKATRRRNNRIKMLRILLSKEIDIEAKTKDDDAFVTPLKLASIRRDICFSIEEDKHEDEMYRKIIEILKEHGADQSVLKKDTTIAEQLCVIHDNTIETKENLKETKQYTKRIKENVEKTRFQEIAEKILLTLGISIAVFAVYEVIFNEKKSKSFCLACSAVVVGAILLNLLCDFLPSKKVDDPVVEAIITVGTNHKG